MHLGKFSGTQSSWVDWAWSSKNVISSQNANMVAYMSEAEVADMDILEEVDIQKDIGAVTGMLKESENFWPCWGLETLPQASLGRIVYQVMTTTWETPTRSQPSAMCFFRTGRGKLDWAVYPAACVAVATHVLA